MARKPSTKPLRKADDGSINALFTSGAADPALDTDDLEAGKNKPESPSVSDLLQQIGALNQKVEDLSKVNTFSIQAQPIAPTAPQPPILSMDGLPDPAYEKDEYNKMVAQRFQSYTQDMLKFNQNVAEQHRSLASSQEDKSKALWEAFQEEHSDYADNEDRVLFASQQVAEEARARGVDLEKYMFGHRDQFMRDVVSRMDKVFGSPTKGEEETGKEPEEEASRTAGLFGGNAGTAAPRASGKEAAGDMIKDIQSMQLKSGFY